MACSIVPSMMLRTARICSSDVRDGIPSRQECFRRRKARQHEVSPLLLHASRILLRYHDDEEEVRGLWSSFAEPPEIQGPPNEGCAYPRRDIHTRMCAGFNCRICEFNNTVETSSFCRLHQEELRPQTRAGALQTQGHPSVRSELQQVFLWSLYLINQPQPRRHTKRSQCHAITRENMT